MRGPEKRLWKWLSGFLPEGHYSRIESPDTAPGFPDVKFQLLNNWNRSCTGTLELKSCRENNPFTQGKKLFRTENEGLHKSQRIWIRNEIRHGGIVFIVAEVPPLVFFLDGDYYNKFNGSTATDLLNNSHIELDRKAFRSEKSREIQTKKLRDFLWRLS